ncbi:hypothetical protein MMC13_003128 [Lambiella insularis]|nr:hypothetical protein [Lambiella insularis]
MTKPIHLFTHTTTPNPRKVIIIFEELGIPFEAEEMDVSALHTPAFEKHNPNGRVPCIHDPNTGITLWESGAIILYLIETYDTEYKLHAKNAPEKFLEYQWLMFQVSGQGPYFGQAAWFVNFHPEKIQSAKDRYINEIKRVTKVLDAALEGKEYLVDGRCSYADLSFLTWFGVAQSPSIDPSGGLAKELDGNANWKAWMDRLMARPAVKKAFEDKAKH